jgi:HD superfamily phosphohydrolase
MALEIVRRIRGNLHGSTDISALEDLVIDHPLFQRLRRIQQTAFLSLVFPGATHSRFEHSIGVMHLAGIAWSKLKSNQARLALATKKYNNFSERERRSRDGENHGLLFPTFEFMDEIYSSDYTIQALRLAALLHDLGHPPFSHSGEKFLPNLKDIRAANPELPEYLSAHLIRLEAKKTKRGVANGLEAVKHEIYTLILADRLLRDIYRENPNIHLVVDPQDVLSIIEPDIAPTENSSLEKFNVRQVCHELVSGEIDIDRMDYLLRDSKECGVVYGIFDADRILDSLCIYFEPRDGSLHLAIQFSGLAALEDYFRARQSMYLQLYFHKTSVAAEAMLQNILTHLNNWRLPADPDKYAEVDEYNFGQNLKDAAQIEIKDPSTRTRIMEEVDDLLYRRRLWKRVFELSGVSNAVRHNPSVELAKKVLTNINIPFEQVSSSNLLTNFRPRELKKHSQNYLRLVKRDSKQFPRVVPIEDHSSLVGSEHTVHITRLYVKNRPGPDGESLVAKAFKALNIAFDD